MILFINGEVTPKTSEAFINSIQDEPLEIHIDSKGGDLFAGLKMFNALQNHTQSVDIIIDGLAGSVASVIALAGDKPPQITKTGSIMVHNALVPQTSGNHHDLRKIANTLEQYSTIVASVYADKTKLTIQEAIELMNSEIPITADDAIEIGFASSIVEPLKAVAYIDKIDMTVLDKIKSKLSVSNNLETPTDVPTVEAETTEESPQMQFDEAQIAEITAIVEAVVAEALAGSPTEESVGNTIATVLNSIVSDGKPPQSANPLMVETQAEANEGIVAFNKKMNEIKEQA